MERTKSSGKTAMKVAIYILLITWIVLLVLLAAIYMLRMKGYNNFKEWQDRNNVQEVLKPGIVGPSPTKIIVPTNTPTPTDIPETTATPTSASSPEPTLTDIPEPTAKLSPTTPPTATPTVTPVPTQPLVTGTVFSGNAWVDAKLNVLSETIFENEEDVSYFSCTNGIYFSVVFQREDEIFPVVYNLDTAEQVSGSDLIKDTYFAIVKERLQNYVAETYPKEAADAFVSYEQIYQAEDYQKFYLTAEELVFCFDAGTLTAGNPAFSYACDLNEAKAFFKNNLDGSANGPVIRELDPNAKMIAITFDDGPHPKVENLILEMLKEYDARATFFFLGKRTEEWYPEMPGTVFAAGHEVASHTYSHREGIDFSRISNEEIWSEINRANLVIAKSTGYAPDYVRFPGGTAGSRSLEVPMVAVNWNIDSVDYKHKNKKDGATIIFDRLKEYMDRADGGIVLMHSIYQNSYEGIKLFIDYLTKEGYEFVTLSELFYYKGITPESGIVYLDGNGTVSNKYQ